MDGYFRTRGDRRVPNLSDITTYDLLGRLIVRWNNLEQSARALLDQISGYPPRIQAMTVEMGGLQLANALRSVAPVSLRPDTGEHVAHFATGFDRLRDHRNHFIHGAREVLPNTEGMRVQRARAKRKIEVFEQAVDKSAIYHVGAECIQFSFFAQLLTIEVMMKNADQLDQLPDMPPLPPLLNSGSRT